MTRGPGAGGRWHCTGQSEPAKTGSHARPKADEVGDVLYTLIYFSPTGNVQHLANTLAGLLGPACGGVIPLESP